MINCDLFYIIITKGFISLIQVKLRKSKKKKKQGRSSMIFISEEKERMNTLDLKRVSKIILQT